MLMMMMSNGGLGSVASAVARAVGAGHAGVPMRASGVPTHGLAIAVGALFMIPALPGADRLYHALGGLPRRSTCSAAILELSFCRLDSVWIVNLLAAALRSGNVKVPAAVTALVGAVVMIPASPILICGFGRIPRLGIAGAGIAFGVYYGAAMLVLLRIWHPDARAWIQVRSAPVAAIRGYPPGRGCRPPSTPFSPTSPSSW